VKSTISPRLTIRRLMLVVAGIAVIFGFAVWMIRMTGRSNQFDGIAARQAHSYFASTYEQRNRLGEG
jgi:hypothetical protein